MASEYFCVFPRKARTGNTEDSLDYDEFHELKEPITGDVSLVFEDDKTWVYIYNATSYTEHDGYDVIRSAAVASVNPGRWILEGSFKNTLDRHIDGGTFAETEISTEWDLIKASTAVDGGSFSGAQTQYTIDLGTF